VIKSGPFKVTVVKICDVEVIVPRIQVAAGYPPPPLPPFAEHVVPEIKIVVSLPVSPGVALITKGVIGFGA